MRTEQATLVGVVEIPMHGGRKAIALMFDNMRWMLEFSENPADYEALKKEIGSTVSMRIDDDDEGRQPIFH